MEYLSYCDNATGHGDNHSVWHRRCRLLRVDSCPGRPFQPTPAIAAQQTVRDFVSPLVTPAPARKAVAALFVLMSTLAANGLECVKRPPDGACFFWSAGTALGTYGRSTFDLLGIGNYTDSPIDHARLPESQPLLTIMRADRRSVAEWLKYPAHAYVLRNEDHLWTDQQALYNYRYEFGKKRRAHGMEAFTLPAGCAVDGMKADDIVRDRCYAGCAHIKAYTCIKGVDIAVIHADRRKRGVEVVEQVQVDSADDTENCMTLQSWSVDVAPRRLPQ